ncbi:MAG: putative Ig domain-containing protein [Candidatus Woesearchaeota archaeon]
MKTSKTMIWVLILLLSAFLVSANPILSPVGNKQVSEGSQLIIQLDATPADSGGRLFFTNASASTTGSSFNTGTGLYTWTPGYADAGVYAVRFGVKDLNSNSTEDITITVLNSNRAPDITSSAITTVYIGNVYSYQVAATDLDNDTLTYSLITFPSGMAISNTGLVQWTPTTPGTYAVKIRVSDGPAFDEQSYNLVVSYQGSALTFNDINAGGSTAEREKTYISSFTIRNVGIDALSAFQCTSTAAAAFKVNVTGLPSSLNAGAESTTPRISVYIPEEQDGGKQKIGDVTCQAIGSTTATHTVSLYLTTENNIDIYDMDLGPTGDTEDVDEGDSVEVKPGEEITFEIELKNTGDKDMDSVTITVENEELDIDEEEEIADLKDGDRERVTFTFELESDVDQDDYDLLVTVEAEDEDGGKHNTTTEVTLEVKKEKHQIQIKSIDLSNIVLSCDRTTDLDVRIENIGRDDEDEVAVEIESTGLDYKKKISDIELDTGDDDTVSFVITVGDDVKQGTYQIRVTTYYETTKKSESDTIDLVIQSCGTPKPPVDDDDEPTTPPDDDDGIDVVPTPTPTPTPTPGTTYQPVFGGQKESFLESTGYLVLLGVLGLILIVLIIVLLASMARR